MPSAAAETRDGQLLAGRYRVERLLGEGGNGAVFAVKDERTGAAVALKMLLDCDDPERVTRFLREAKATMRLSSEHVIRVLEVGSVDGKTPFIVMERLDGHTVKDLLKQSSIDERRAADLALQACEGLAHAHAQGIVHRDVKPSNLFVTKSDVLKVLDFGISKVTSQADWEKTATVTQSEAILGSPHFISPEQLRNAAKVDERADVWSLGVVLYHALSKRYPFDGPSLAEIFVAIMHRKLSPIGSATPEMEAIVARCLERDPNQRYGDVGELARALAPLASAARAARAEKIVALVGDSRARRVAIEEERRDGTLSLDDPPAVDETITLVDRGPPSMAHEPEQGAPEEGAVRASTPPQPPLLTPAHAMLPSSPPATAPRRRVGPIAAVLVGVLLVVATWGIATALRKDSSAANIATTSTAPTNTASIASTSSPSAPGPVASTAAANAAPVLELVADAPIAKVVVANAQKVSLEKGRAFVTVSPWKGDLAIEAELTTGAFARGTAHEGGSSLVQLTTMKRVATGKPRPKPPGTTSAKGAGELHDDPYKK